MLIKCIKIMFFLPEIKLRQKHFSITSYSAMLYYVTLYTVMCYELKENKTITRTDNKPDQHCHIVVTLLQLVKNTFQPL